MTGVTLDIDRLGRIPDASGMRIVSVAPVLLSHVWEIPEAWSGGVLPGVTAGLARVVADNGLEGVGETYAGNMVPEAAAALIAYFGERLVGRDPSDIGSLIGECRDATRYWGRTGLAVAALSAVESALWDLCGKALGLPVVALLGGVQAEGGGPRGYASAGMEATAEGLAAEMSRHLADGFHAVKIRTGMSAAADREKAAIARTTLGADVALAVDAVQGSNPRPWSAPQAIEAGYLLEDLDLVWYEEPCAADDIDGYVACRRALSIPIAGAETLTTADALRPYLDAGAFDIVQPDASHIGGVAEAVRAGHLAETHGVQVAMHAWGSGPCVMANIHAGMAMPNCHWLEIPRNDNPLIDDLLVEPIVLRDGKVKPPTAPGLGIALTPEIEARYPYRKGAHYHFTERRGQDGQHD